MNMTTRYHLCSFLLLVAAGSTVGASDGMRPMLGFEDNAEERMPQKATFKAKTYPQETVFGGIRRLQPTTTLLNALINIFAPNLEDRIETEADKSDPMYLGYITTEPQGEVALNFNQSWCNETTALSSIQYTLGTTTGMASMEVTRLELVGGSENIDINLGIPTGADWSGTWILEAEFTQFDAATTAKASNTFCNFTFEEVKTGNTLLTAPSGAMRIQMRGTTGDIFNFAGSSQLTSVNILESSIGYGTILPQLGMFNGMVTMSAEDPLVELGQTELMNEDLRLQVQNNMQEQINKNLPITIG